MSLSLSLAELLQAYLFFFLLLVTVLYVVNKLRNHNQAWENSKSRLMTCRNCGKFFMRRRLSINDDCPHCGRKSVAFRLPKSEISHK